VQPEPESHGVDQPADSEFRCRIDSTNAAHVFGALLRAEIVHNTHDTDVRTPDPVPLDFRTACGLPLSYTQFSSIWLNRLPSRVKLKM
jgi:hypothetical protein